MKKRHPIAATLLTTAALLGLGALPAVANNPPTLDSTLDNYANDVLLQGAPSNDQFELEVDPYPGENDGSYYVGLTTGVLHDLTANTYSDAFQMFCVDFNHDISGLPVYYNINIESILGPGEPDPNPPGLGLSLTTLQTQALLGADFNGTLPNDSDVQHDIWNLSYTGNGPLPFTPPTANMTTLLDNATNALATSNFSNAYLFDIVDADGQAFMPIVPGGFNNSSQPPVPEPGTLAMLGLGLIGLGSLKLRRSPR